MANLLFKRIKDWSTSISTFRTGDVIPVDGPSGTAKMSKDDLLTETAQSTLAGNLAPAFDPTRDENHKYLAGQTCVKDGVLYEFTCDHWGPWNARDVHALTAVSLIDKHIGAYSADRKVTVLTVSNWTDGYAYRPLYNTTTSSTSQSVSNKVQLPERVGASFLHFTNSTFISTAINVGMGFFDINGNKVGDYYAIAGAESDGYVSDSVEIPADAFSVIFSFRTDALPNFTASVEEVVPHYESNVGKIATDLRKYSDSLESKKIDIGPMIEGEAWNAKHGYCLASASSSRSYYVRLAEGSGRTLTYLRIIATIDDPVTGTAFFDKNLNFIGGIPDKGGSASFGTEEYTANIPDEAAYVVFTALKSEVSAFYAIVTSRFNRILDVDAAIGHPRTISSETSLAVSSWTQGKKVEWYNGTIVGYSSFSASAKIPLPSAYARTLTYTQWKVTAPNPTGGLAFYDSNNIYISGDRIIANASEAGYVTRTIDVPASAASVAFTFGTTQLSNFSATVNFKVAQYTGGLGSQVEALEAAVFGGTGNYSQMQCLQRFGIAMDEKCASLGITGQSIYGPAGFGTIDWSGDGTHRGFAYIPIYGIVRYFASALGYPQLAKIWSENSHVIRTKGVEADIAVTRTLDNHYGSIILSDYTLLGWKTGTWGGNLYNLGVIATCDDLEGKVLVAVGICNATGESESNNRMIAVKALLDIGKTLIKNRSADISAYEATLEQQFLANGMVITLPFANPDFLEKWDLLNSNFYTLYTYGSANAVVNAMSMIKLLTAELALDYITNIDEYVTVTSEDISISEGGSSPLFAEGEQVTYRDLLYGLLLPSSNQAGYIIARKVGEKLLNTYRGNGFTPS